MWDQKVQNSVFYEAFLPITTIKPSAGVTKYSKCMGSHVAYDLTVSRTVRMVRLCSNRSAPPHFSFAQDGKMSGGWEVRLSFVKFRCKVYIQHSVLLTQLCLAMYSFCY